MGSALPRGARVVFSVDLSGVVTAADTEKKGPMLVMADPQPEDAVWK
jgi:hypothetical protein